MARWASCAIFRLTVWPWDIFAIQSLRCLIYVRMIYRLFWQLGSQPEKVSCHGAAHITPGVADMLATGLGFANGITAAMHTSWLSPIKEHRLTVTGHSGSLVFDDTEPWSEKLTLFSDHITQAGNLFVVERPSQNYLPVAEDEPLKQEVLAFAEVCATGQPALTNAAEGVAVQRVLEKMVNLFEMTNSPRQPILAFYFSNPQMESL